MSIQDKIFDVVAALDGKPEKELFSEIMNYYFGVERQLESLQDFVDDLRKGAKALNLLTSSVSQDDDDAG